MSIAGDCVAKGHGADLLLYVGIVSVRRVWKSTPTMDEEEDTRAEELVASDDEDKPINISAPRRTPFFGVQPRDPVEMMKDQLRSHKRKAEDDSDSDSDFKLGSEAEESDGGWGLSGGSGLIAAKQRHEKKRKCTFLKPTPKPKPKTLAEEIDNLAAAPPVAGVVRDSPPAYIPGDPAGNGEVPAPPDIFDWTDIDADEEEENPISPDWCALCKVTQRAIDINPENQFYKDLIDDARVNWSKRSAGETGTELQKQYNEKLRPYIEPEELQLPCRKYIFWWHFVDHCYDPVIEAQINNKIVQELINTITREQLFVIDPLTKRKKVTSNPKPTAMFFKLLAQKDKLAKQILALGNSAVV